MAIIAATWHKVVLSEIWNVSETLEERFMNDPYKIVFIYNQ
jgi:hypothetical protein